VEVANYERSSYLDAASNSLHDALRCCISSKTSWPLLQCSIQRYISVEEWKLRQYSSAIQTLQLIGVQGEGQIRQGGRLVSAQPAYFGTGRCGITPCAAGTESRAASTYDDVPIQVSLDCSYTKSHGRGVSVLIGKLSQGHVHVFGSLVTLQSMLGSSTCGSGHHQAAHGVRSHGMGGIYQSQRSIW
jgi:hypothetical protein